MSRWRLSHALAHALAPLLAGALGVVLVVVLMDLPDHSGLADPVAQAMDRAGVGHDVTAVLLNFRGYDTFLELAVLLLAVWVVWSLGRHDPVPARSVRGPVMRGTLRHLLPAAVLTGGYLVWVGADATGGAFQGGAVLGAAGVILILSRPRSLPWVSPMGLRLGIALGVLVFLGSGVAGLLGGHGFMGYHPDWAYGLILTVEVAAAVSIGLGLVLLFLGGRPQGDDDDD